MSLIPGRGIGVRGIILAKPSVAVLGKTHVRRSKCKDWVEKNYGLAFGWMVARSELEDTLLIVALRYYDQSQNPILYNHIPRRFRLS